MRGNKLLVCIASHDPQKRMEYVESLIKRFSTYTSMDTTIIVDTNIPIHIDGAIVDPHLHLDHPYHLTWMHRKHFKASIDKYDWFIYLEDDMDIPFEGFNEYRENFDMLWQVGCVPSFIRVEKFNEKMFVTDVTSTQTLNLIHINKKDFTTLTQPYHAFWIMPQNILRKTMGDTFVRVDVVRELAASYPMWELGRKPLVRVENGQISPLCYSYHLPNNYASYFNTQFGKIEVNNILT